MIAIVKPGTPKEGVAQLCEIIESKGVSTSVIEGANQTIIGLVGDTTRIDPYLLESNSMVEAVRRVSEPFKKSNRKFHPDDTVIEVGGVKIGGKGNFAVMAGPCSVESEEQCMVIAEQVKKHGAADFPRWRVQAPHEPLFLPRLGQRGPRHPLEGKARVRHAYHYRNHGRSRPRSF